MNSASTHVIVYSVLILLASLAGGWIPLVARFSHTGTQLLMSFVAGLMLGVGVFHMIPHAFMESKLIDHTVWWVMVGLLTMFFLQRFFHFHQHGPAEYEDDEETEHDHIHEDGSKHDHDHEHDHQHGHVHGPDCEHGHAHGHAPELSWLGVFVGLTIHTLLDGIALAASVQVDYESAPAGVWFFGIATFLAVVLHKPLDAMAITSLMVASGWSPASRKLVNAAFALMVPLGAALFYLGIKNVAADQHLVIGGALAFSAGTFLCISLSDLLPELQFHSHDRVKLSAALLLGIALAYGIGVFEHVGHDHRNGAGHVNRTNHGHSH